MDLPNGSAKMIYPGFTAGYHSINLLRVLSQCRRLYYFRFSKRPLMMKRYYLIDHKFLFLFGYVFYLFTPLLIGGGSFFKGFPGMDLYQGYFNSIPENKLLIYILVSLSWLPAFYLGHLLFKLLWPRKRSLEIFPATSVTHGTTYVAILLLIALLIFAYMGRASLFAGYGSYDINTRGKMSTLLVIFNFFLLYQLLTRQKLSLFLIAGVACTALLLLSMGGRMYVFQTFIILLVYKTSFAQKRWKGYHIAAVTILAVAVASASGIWRMGYALDLQKAAYSFLAEPVFTWFSTSTFLSSNNIPLVSFPWNFLTSFLNMVPNTVFSLQQYVISTKEMGYIYENPLGAESAWTTFIINFGVLGSFVFIFIAGFVLNMLRSFSENNRFAAVYYIMVCGILPFQFFRDGFYILNKQLVFNFFLLPAVILSFLQLIVYSQRLLQRAELNRSASL